MCCDWMKLITRNVCKFAVQCGAMGVQRLYDRPSEADASQAEATDTTPHREETSGFDTYTQLYPAVLRTTICTDNPIPFTHCKHTLPC